MDTAIVWCVSDIWLYTFCPLPYMCASAIINYNNCAFCLVLHQSHYFYIWLCVLLKKMQEEKKEKRNDVTLLHKSKFAIAIRSHSLSFKGRSEQADTEELALATNSGSSWTLHRLYWVSWGKLAFNTLANWENIINTEKQQYMQTIWKETTIQLLEWPLTVILIRWKGERESEEWIRKCKSNKGMKSDRLQGKDITKRKSK